MQIDFGSEGWAVGASFAVRVDEEVFAAGWQLLTSVTSSGQMATTGHAPPFFMVLE